MDPIFQPIQDIGPGDVFRHNNTDLKVISVNFIDGKLHVGCHSVSDSMSMVTLIFPVYGMQLPIISKADGPVFVRYYVPTAGEVTAQASFFPGLTVEDAARHFWYERGGSVMVWPQTFIMIDSADDESGYDISVNMVPLFSPEVVV